MISGKAGIGTLIYMIRLIFNDAINDRKKKMELNEKIFNPPRQTCRGGHLEEIYSTLRYLDGEWMSAN